MKQYRLYTENRPNVLGLCKEYLNNFTILSGQGCYYGDTEDCIVIEVIMEEDIASTLIHLARCICSENNQTEVLITETKCDTIRVGQSGVL